MSKLGSVKREEGGREGKREERKREKSESSKSDFVFRSLGEIELKYL